METEVYAEPQIIAEAAGLLRKPLSMADEDLEMHIIALDALRYDVSVATTNTQQLLYVKRKQLLWPKDLDKSLTELDRSTRLNADTAPIQRDYDLLLRIEALLDSKLLICMQLLH